MRTGFPLGFLIVVIVLVMAGATAVTAQWKKTLFLRADLAALKTGATELKRLQAENARLKARQIPPGELQKLREDHEAVARLRAELDALQKRASGSVR